MNPVPSFADAGSHVSTALETNFPVTEISRIAQQESWRKEIYRPAYHIHKWWARRLGSVFRGITLGALTGSDIDIWEEFYYRHKLADKVVLDPFMGSGTTLGEALKLGARAIGCDINPVSTFMVRQALTQVSQGELIKAFEHLELSVAPEIRRYYETEDPKTGDKIPVLYYFWCKTVTTPEGEVIPLFSRYVFAQNANPRKFPGAWAVCPCCWDIMHCRYDATDIDCPKCGRNFNPQIGPASGQFVQTKEGQRLKIKDLLPTNGKPPRHRLYALIALRHCGEKVYLPARQGDIELYQEAVTRLHTEDLPLPTQAVRPGHNTNQARGYNYLRWRDFFNRRQLLCLGLLLRQILKIQDESVQEQMLCLFSGTLEFNNLFCTYKGEGTGAVRHMFSNHILKPERTPLENSVWGTRKSSGTFSTLFESRLLRAKRYLREPFELQVPHDMFGAAGKTRKVLASDALNPQCVENWEEFRNESQAVMVLNGDSANLPIPDESVDAVVTDPPYFDFIHYSELSDFFFAWLSPVLANRYPWMQRPDCSDAGEVQQHDPQVFARNLSRVFTECCRVMKPNGVLAFSFHHSRPEGWAAIHEALRIAGLGVAAAHMVHGELSVSSPKSSAKEPISLDAILVCRKLKRLSKDTLNWQSIGPSGLDSSMSLGDRFVVGAAETLVKCRKGQFGYEEMITHLSNLKSAILAGRVNGNANCP